MRLLHVRYGLYGLILGFVLSRTGFSDYGELHKMFLFTDLRLFLTFCGAVMLTTGGLAVGMRRAILSDKSVHAGNIAGGVLFGVGWAVTGACPSIALVNIGEGKLAAVATAAGILVGAKLYPEIHRRFFPWPVSSCDT